MYRISWDRGDERLSKEFKNYEQAQKFTDIKIYNTDRNVTLEFTPSGEGWSEKAYGNAFKWVK